MIFELKISGFRDELSARSFGADKRMRVKNFTI